MKVLALLISVLLLVVGCVTHTNVNNTSEWIAPGPPNGMVKIQGEVLHPGEYQYKSGMKVMDLVTAAGGLSDFGSGIKVVRGGTNFVNIYHGGPTATTKSKFMSTLLTAGDVVIISRMRY